MTCPNCESYMSHRCNVCGYEGKPLPDPKVETAEAPQETEAAATKRPARKSTAQKRA